MGVQTWLTRRPLKLLGIWFVSLKRKGLGVIDLYVQNGALLLKNLHKFFNKANLPWVHLIWNNYYSDIKLQGYTKRGSSCWRDNIQPLTQFKGFASPLPKSGSTIHFWEDLWGGCVPKWAYPELLSFVKTKNLSLQKAADTYNLGDLFHLPLTAEAFTQLESLLDGIDSCNLGTEDDIWVYIWGANDYSLRQAYRFIGRYILLSNGSGSHVVNSSTSFSSGFS
jgi:hypothetical protein